LADLAKCIEITNSEDKEILREYDEFKNFLKEQKKNEKTVFKRFFRVN
jgi:hypothetical protein